MMQTLDQRKLALLGLAVILIAAAAVNLRFWPTDTKGEDVYYAWVEGGRILNGENPYARVLAGNMRDNQKYATYFPVFYELSYLTQWAGLREYDDWITFWRVIFTLFDLGIAVVLFALLSRRRQTELAFFAALFWLFNRWTLHVVQVAHLDFIAIFLLIASLGVLPRRRWLALFLFSLSLGVKQIAIFLVPLYLIWVWQTANRAQPGQMPMPDAAPRSTKIGSTGFEALAGWLGEARNRLKPLVRNSRRGFLGQIALAALVIASVPLLASLPFLAWNAEGFVRSILFSATRLPADHFGVPSFDGHMGWVGLPAKLPMLALMALIYWLAARRKIGRFTGALLVMVTFVDFNSVLFNQYLAWIVPLLPLVVCDVADGGPDRGLAQ